MIVVVVVGIVLLLYFLFAVVDDYEYDNDTNDNDKAIKTLYRRGASASWRRRSNCKNFGSAIRTQTDAAKSNRNKRQLQQHHKDDSDDSPTGRPTRKQTKAAG